MGNNLPYPFNEFDDHITRQDQIAEQNRKEKARNQRNAKKQETDRKAKVAARRRRNGR